MYMPRFNAEMQKLNTKGEDTMTSQANNVTAIDSKKPTTKQD